MTSTVKIPEGWEKIKLSSLIEIKHGFAFKGEYISDIDNGKVLLTPGNFLIGGGRKEGKKRYTGEIPSDYILKAGDLIVTMTDLSKDGDTLGYPALVPNDESRTFLHNQRIGLVTITNEKIDKIFLYYLMRNREYQKYIVNFASGSTVRHTSPDRIRSYEFFLPTKDEQKIIAKTLSSFDDKIELLRAENQTLEEMGQTLFKERFPHNNPCIRFGDFVEVKRGGSPRPIQDFISDTGYRRLKISDATAETSPYIFNIKERIKESGLKKTVHLDAGSLILSNSATPGIPKILAVDSCIHDGWLYFPKSKFSKEFLYLLFLTIRPDLLAQGSGSVFTNLKTDILKGYLLPDYGKESLDNFQKIIEPIFQKIKTNSEEIESLSKTRDQLLPKLMSGEVRVEF